MRSLGLIFAFAVVTSPSIAAAQLIASDGPPPPPPPPPPAEQPEQPPPRVATPRGPAWHYHFAFAGGAESAVGHTWAQVGTCVGVARRVLGPVALALRGELLTTHRTPETADGTIADPITARTLRALAGLEVTAYRTHGAFSPTVVITGGIGREHMSWDDASLDRRVAYVGAEVRPSFSFGSPPPRGFRELGFQIGVRVQAARAAGPSDLGHARATSREAGTDLGVLFYYGIAVGR